MLESILSMASAASPWPGLRAWFARLVLACVGAWAGLAHAQDCRIAFDMGSSGVRAATSSMHEGAASSWRDIDLLSPLMNGQALSPLLPAVASALRELPQQAQMPAHCSRLGGGFSAWRLAWRRDGAQLAGQLQDLRQQTGVAVLVIPATVEGRYGHDSAKQALGERLKTSHILDIGGGSMQVAGHDRSFGIELGQKSWQQLLCRSLGRGAGPCVLLPLQAAELAQARALVAEHLRSLPAEVGEGTLTAISRPVTRGIRLALRAMGFESDEALSLKDLGQAIDRLSATEPAQVSGLTQAPAAFAGFLISDMLLVEGVLRTMQLDTLSLAEASINNLPALLRDDRAFAWARQHDCYVQRLRELGPAAYFSDPAFCGKP